jgi:DnaJ family protein A protein 1
LDEKEHALFRRSGIDIVMKMDINITESLCGFKKTVTTLDNRTLVIQTIPGEIIKNGDLKCVFGEGMPTYRNPFEKGKLIIQFSVTFPDSLSPQVCEKLEALLPPKEEPMVPEEHEEVNMNDYDPTTRRQRTMSEDDEDQMHGHGPGVSCATQ